MWGRLTRYLTLGSLLIVLAGTATAREIIDFDTAIAKTLASNPALVSFGYQLKAQDGRVLDAAMRPGVEVGIDVENAVGTGNLSGVDGVEATISLVWVLERGKRQRRIDTARAGLSLLRSDAEVRRLDAAAETARLYLQSLAHQARMDLANEAVKLADQTVRVVARRVEAGRTPRADLARAEAGLSRVLLEREDLTHQLKTSIRRLAAQWGDTNPGFAAVRGDLADLPYLDDFETLLTRMDQNPVMRRLLSERRLRTAELRQMEANAMPDWRVTAGVRQLQLTDDQALVAGITIPLGAKKRNQGQVATARADLARTDADRTDTRVQIETRLFVLYEELKHSLHRAHTLRDDILPRMETALRETLRAYELGRYSYFELRSAQDEALRARMEATAALIDAHRNIIEIEVLTGVALSSPARQR